MKRDVEVYIEDIQESISKIEEYTKAVTGMSRNSPGGLCGVQPSHDQVVSLLMASRN